MMSYVSGEKGKVQLLSHVLLFPGCVPAILQCMHQLAARGWPHAGVVLCCAELPPEQLSGCLAAASPSAGLQWCSLGHISGLQLLRSNLPNVMSSTEVQHCNLSSLTCFSHMAALISLRPFLDPPLEQLTPQSRCWSAAPPLFQPAVWHFRSCCMCRIVLIGSW